mmetsp:Transcript_64078/g.164865  ORF Transcript_64078/g.164865 Transcript_64078/m.164865 type:complete len:201 (+) Transcript_64078:440-1042(+)
MTQLRKPSWKPAETMLRPRMHPAAELSRRGLRPHLSMAQKQAGIRPTSFMTCMPAAHSKACDSPTESAMNITMYAPITACPERTLMASMRQARPMDLWHRSQHLTQICSQFVRSLASAFCACWVALSASQACSVSLISSGSSAKISWRIARASACRPCISRNLADSGTAGKAKAARQAVGSSAPRPATRRQPRSTRCSRT